MKTRIATLTFLLVACTPHESRRLPPPPANTTASQPPAATGVQSAPSCLPAPHRLCPRDDGASDPDFAAFRERLRDAVARKDDAALMTFVDPQIRVSFGEGGGAAEFRKGWKLPSADSPLWTELASILALGGTFLGEGAERTFWAPYVYSTWPDQLDAFENVAAVRNDVPLFDKADDASRRTGIAQYDVLRLLPSPDDDRASRWKHIQTADGKEAWVHASDVRSPIGYRAGFSKRSGAWKLEALVAGD